MGQTECVCARKLGWADPGYIVGLLDEDRCVFSGFDFTHPMVGVACQMANRC